MKRRTVRGVKIRNKYDPSCFLDVGVSNEVVGKTVAPSTAQQWSLVNLAPLGE
jgi:hypothetical protein